VSGNGEASAADSPLSPCSAAMHSRGHMPPRVPLRTGHRLPRIRCMIRPAAHLFRVLPELRPGLLHARTRSMCIALRLVPGLLAGSVLLGDVSGVLAATRTPKPHWIALGGQVSALSGSTFTLTPNPKAVAKRTTPKTVQVTLAVTTKQQPRVGTTAPLASGDFAVVVGTGTQTAVTATHTIYGATTFPVARVASRLRAQHTLAVLPRHTVRGTVQTGTTTGLTITTKAGRPSRSS
jgi:hypothetical protein